jgi:acyl carrier protein
MELTTQDIRSKVLAAVGERTGKPVKDEVTFRDSGLDSLTVLELFMAIEEECGLNAIPDKRAGDLRTPADLIAYVQHEKGLAV